MDLLLSCASAGEDTATERLGNRDEGHLTHSPLPGSSYKESHCLLAKLPVFSYWRALFIRLWC